jgi:hypothetical protein
VKCSERHIFKTGRLGVGGSNPLAPTISPQQNQQFTAPIVSIAGSDSRTKGRQSAGLGAGSPEIVPNSILGTYSAWGADRRNPQKQNAPGRNTEGVLPKSAQSDDDITIDPGASLGDCRTQLDYLTDQHRQCLAPARERELIGLDHRGTLRPRRFSNIPES